MDPLQDEDEPRREWAPYTTPSQEIPSGYGGPGCCIVALAVGFLILFFAVMIFFSGMGDDPPSGDEEFGLGPAIGSQLLAE